MEQQQSPCKTFNKKRALACYRLRFIPSSPPRFEHIELYRISNETRGEYYVLPWDTLQKHVNRHLSYHQSGVFHWREADGRRIFPRDGEADQRGAELVAQAMAHLSGRLDGYCIAKGRDVSDDALRVMTDILDGYIIPPLKVLPAYRLLKERKNFTIPMLWSPHKNEAQNLFAEDAKVGHEKLISRDEVISGFTVLGVEKSKIFIDPKITHFGCYSDTTTTKVMQIAHQMVSEKLRHKPNAFWTTQTFGSD